MATSDRAGFEDVVGRLSARIFRVRWVVRAPILLFRAGLGFLLTSRLCWLEHRGRTSGEIRSVVLEVVDRPAPDVVVLASGFGASSQWYRNLRADPRARVSVGRRYRVPARAELLDPAESAERLRVYAARHPRDWQALLAMMRAYTGEEHPDAPVVVLHLRPRAPN